VTLDRRWFLKAGGVTLLGAALAACTDDKPKAVPGQTTTTKPTTTSSGATGSDVALIKTAASLESLAISVYQRAAGSNLVKDPEALDAVTLFLSHHMTQQQALNALLAAADVPTITSPNAAVEKVFQPALATAQTQADVLRLAFTLEDAMAQTYVYATGVVTKPAQRVTLMSIAGVQARHRLLLGSVFDTLSPDELFPSAFAKSDNPLPPDAILN
jgi:hypothetical protein